MTPLNRDQLVALAKSQIIETTPQALNERLRNGVKPLVVDIRERDEFEQGHVPGAVFIPRGFLELRIEQYAFERETPIVLYCAGGVRSALAARNVKEMGYEHVESLIGGFGGWKSAGLPVKVPKMLTGDQKIRYSRHTLLPDVGEEGQLELLAARVLLIGAGGLGSPGRALPGCRGRRHAGHRRFRRRGPEQLAAPDTAQRKLDWQAQGRVGRRRASRISTPT